MTRYCGLLALALLSAPLALLVGCNGQASELDAYKEAVDAEVMRVPVGAVVARDFERTVDGTGTLRAIRRTVLMPDVTGRIVELPVDVGEHVEAGQELIRIRATEYENREGQARAALEVAQARLKDLRAWERPEAVDAHRAALAEARAARDRTRRDYERKQELLQAGAVAQADVDRAREDASRAAAAVLAAEANLRSATSGPTGSEVDVARAEVRVEEAALAEASRLLSDTVIRAPYAGVVTDKMAEVGQNVNEQMQTEMLEISDISTLEAWFLISEGLASMLHVGELGRVTVVSTGQIFDATISAVNVAARESVRSFLVKAKIDNSDGQLRAGLYVRGTLTLERRENVPAVAVQALRFLASEGRGTGVENHNRAMLFLLSPDNTVQPLEVQTGLQDQGYIEILSAIEPGQKIIADGSLPLMEGQKVAPRTDEAITEETS